MLRVPQGEFYTDAPRAEFKLGVMFAPNAAKPDGNFLPRIAALIEIW
jgi:hypothetical protein